MANQKGGVGKTTTAVNLSYALSLENKKTLLLDMDPQASTSSGLGAPKDKAFMYPVLMGKRSIHTSCFVVAPGLDLLAADAHLSGAEMELVTQENKVFFLKNAVSSIKSKYDFIVVDTPPSLGLLTLNALVAADAFIVPLQCEYYALEGLGQLLQTARETKERWNASLKLQGILLTLFDSRNRISHQVAEEVHRHFGEQVFQTKIPRNVRLSEAPSFSQSIFQYEPTSTGAKAYEQLAGELLKQISGQRATAPLMEAHV